MRARLYAEDFERPLCHDFRYLASSQPSSRYLGWSNAAFSRLPLRRTSIRRGTRVRGSTAASVVAAPQQAGKESDCIKCNERT